MRLRLTVQRNGLPAANILWSVPETNSTQAYTITRLLEDVNHIIPLEAEHWGLEHYVVEVGGFECLHFMPVVNALKEDDHVSIRPLMTAEIRARTLTGRDQISDGGQHLVDGIPFGRPYLRQPNRPPVRIPPRKRRRLDDGEAEAEPEATALLMEHGEEVEEEEEEPLPLLNGHTVSRSGVNKSGKESKTVHFQEPEIDESDDSEEDDDFVPGDGDESASSAEDSEDDSDSDSGLAAKHGSSSSASDTSDSGSDSDSDSDTSNSDSGSDSDDSDASAPPDVLSSKDGRKTTATKHVPPGQGLKATKVRNSRRTRVNRLRRLIASGVLPEGAGLSDLKKYEEGNFGQPEAEEVSASTQPFSKSQGKRKRLDDEGSAAEDALQLEKRKQELMAKFGDNLSGPVPSIDSVQTQTIPLDEAPAEKAVASRRLRPDTAAIGRILARQAAPVARKGRNKAAVDEVAEPEGASDPDFWKSRINVSAFECWDEEFELSAPPFPFEQHWDPASKAMREKAAKKKQKKKQSHAPQQTYATQEEDEEDEEEKIILDYDDAPAANNESEIIDAAIEDQLQQDLATAGQIDLAPLPEDMSTLPDLTAADMKKGAIIACKFFTVNPITVTPEISGFKTATVEHEGDSGPGAGTIQLRIAARDLVKKEKKFDGKGNRVYNAADALLMESDDEEDGLWEGQFGELLEAKLVKAA
ncbi:hypothetical protein COCMIDRAFT_24368 [Bipolaris oryzae ATCC 44560]|uniref:DUF7357 domain-containing protein n=1 Tax=Bipolaris oryzae ATCC 44560 TaxID=930090 RepID=W6ZK46_COCMI|nr:uncharacterized protein COCMIDRAFT_24368 [Bipolaris oryzae ATCC 44560]EUC47814.1 hypothetical protein COCMIDRAFT_24368 [Bipolaris oryzae ATCC 44560]